MMYTQMSPNFIVGVIDKFGNEISTDSQGSVVASANQELHSKLISLINE